MRKLAVCLLAVAFLCVAFPAFAAEAGKKSWTGNAALDAAFVLNNQGKYAEAFAAFSALHAKGVPMARTMMGRYYEDGRFVPKNLEKARVCFEEAAAKGDFLGAVYLKRRLYGWEFLQEAGIEPLMERVEREAVGGNVLAKAVLGGAYMVIAQIGPGASGWNPPTPYANAVRWTREAAEAGYAPSQYTMADLDPTHAPEWINRAADAGYPKAVKLLQQRESGGGYR